MALISLTARCDQCGAERSISSPSPDAFDPIWQGDFWIVLSHPTRPNRYRATLCSYQCLAAYANQEVKRQDKQARQQRQREAKEGKGDATG